MKENDDSLTRRERRKIYRGEAKKDKRVDGEFFKKFLIVGIVIVVIVGVILWVFRETTKPLPGDTVADLGRDHVDDIFGVEYNSNPPTSGTHFPMWAKKGIYDRLISDGYLIHSQEHGYVIISYDCTKSISSSKLQISNALAHDEPGVEVEDSGQLLMHMKLEPKAGMSAFTPENPPDIEVPLPDEFGSDSCKSLVGDLSKLVNFRDRVIVVPRVGMEKPVIATAWGRILKLDNFDQKKLEEFIDAFHNKGPEKTVE